MKLNYIGFTVKLIDMNLDSPTYEYIDKLFRECNGDEFDLQRFDAGMEKVSYLPKCEIKVFVSEMLAKKQ